MRALWYLAASAVAALAFPPNGSVVLLVAVALMSVAGVTLAWRELSS